MLIGAHVSAAGGIVKALERVAAIGGNCVQIFSGSPRSWARADLGTIDADKIRSKQAELSVSSIFIHTLYLVNLTSPDTKLLRNSTEAVAYDLRLCGHIDAAGVVVHLGSHLGAGWEAVKEQLAEEIAKLLSAAPANAKLLIENAAGQRGKLNSDISEIRWLLDRVADSRLGWCLDSCHAWAAGYQFKPSTDNNICQAKLCDTQDLFAEIDRLKLWEKLACIHVNDSRDGAAAGRDRHANLLEGRIDPVAFKKFLMHPKIMALPLILEVPGMDDQGPDAENIRRLKAFYSS